MPRHRDAGRSAGSGRKSASAIISVDLPTGTPRRVPASAGHRQRPGCDVPAPNADRRYPTSIPSRPASEPRAGTNGASRKRWAARHGRAAGAVGRRRHHRLPQQVRGYAVEAGVLRETGAGKTDVLKTYCSLLPRDLRLVVIEDALEGVFLQENAARLSCEKGRLHPDRPPDRPPCGCGRPSSRCRSWRGRKWPTCSWTRPARATRAARPPPMAAPPSKGRTASSIS